MDLVKIMVDVDVERGEKLLVVDRSVERSGRVKEKRKSVMAKHCYSLGTIVKVQS